MLKLTRLNGNGTKVECVITPERIIGLTEIERQDEPLYDVNGNQIDTKHNDNVFQVLFDNGHTIIIEKATYEQLVAKLNVEDLK